MNQIASFFVVGCNPKQKNSDGFTPRLLSKEKSFKEASKELRKAERVFTKYSKPGMKNPNDPEALFLYDWTCEKADDIRDELMKFVSIRYLFTTGPVFDVHFLALFFGWRRLFRGNFLSTVVFY